MNTEQRFAEYIQAFEDTYADNGWSRLASYFTPDTVYLTATGETIEGRDEVLAFLKGDIDGNDRRFDTRTLVFGDLAAQGNRVTAPWRCTFTKAGAPELVATGVETAEFDGDAIRWMQSSIDDGVAGRFAEWFAAHGGLLED